MEMGAYPELERKWAALNRVLFGQEVGRLAEFEDYLREFNEPVQHKKSTVSGKEVAYANNEYCATAKRMSFDEVDYSKKYAPLGINNIKDIDSLIEAAGERAHYTGNVILGNSKFVEKSSSVSDSHFVHLSAEVAASRYVAYSTIVRDCENVFGCNTGGLCSFLLRCNGFIEVTRCFETWMGSASSDCYYCHNVDGCHDCIFCFNLRNGRFCIGNLPLSKERYLELKKKLVSEIAELVKKKKAPSLVALAAASKNCSAEIRQKLEGRTSAVQQKTDKAVVEKAFEKTTELILGKGLVGMDNYSAWLSRHGKEMKKGKSVISGKEVMCANYGGRFFLPDDRFIADDEIAEFGKEIKLDEGEAEKLGVSNAPALIGKIACFNPSIISGKSRNVIECASVIESNDCYRCISLGHSEKCAYTFVPRYSEHLMGSSWVLRSSFCLKCYNSTKITRCFEVDNATACTGCYFCHNIENCHECMFCFNVKNLKYAIGNAEVGREKYMEAKAALQDWLLGQLAKKKEVELDIFNLGCAGKGKRK